MFYDRGMRERDLDHFLIEEFTASSDFHKWCLGRVSGVFSPPPGGVWEIKRSPPRSDGRQTDLGATCLLDGKVSAVLLIENKAWDGFQEAQPEDYRAEVMRRRQQLGTDRAAAVLIAPRANVQVHNHDCFDASITVEDIAGFLRARLVKEDLGSELRLRLGARIQLLEAICRKGSNSDWAPNPVAEIVDFWTAYGALAKHALAPLRFAVGTAGPSTKTAWFEGFSGDGSFAKIVKLKHELGDVRDSETKYVNLEIWKAAHLESRFRAAHDILPLDGPISIVPTASRLMLRLPTPAVDRDPMRFEEMRPRIEEGFDAIRVLSNWLDQNANRLRVLLREEPEA